VACNAAVAGTRRKRGGSRQDYVAGAQSAAGHEDEPEPENGLAVPNSSHKEAGSQCKANREADSHATRVSMSSCFFKL
jgi:hypothetical protein